MQQTSAWKQLTHLACGLALLATPALAIDTVAGYGAAPPAEPLGTGWEDDIDSYATDSQLHGQGGWKGWGNDPTFGAFAVDDQASSAPNSIEIVGNADLVREFTGITSGVWTFKTSQFIPSGFIGQTYFIMLNTYVDGCTSSPDCNWSVQVMYDSVTGQMGPDFGSCAGSLPIVFDAWTDIEVQIDLDTDVQTFFYGGQQLYTCSWAEGASGGGVANVGAVDLFANGATAVYYDDLSLLPPPPPVADDWVDDLDSYSTDTDIHGQGGWKGWGDDPSVGAMLVDDQAASAPNSVDIADASDVVREYTGVSSGQWTYRVWQYIPTGFAGESYFILLNTYIDTCTSEPDCSWSTQVSFDGTNVINSGGSGGILTARLDEWVPIQVDIDLDNDTQTFTYAGEVLYSGPWTTEVSTAGVLNLGAVDMYANGATSVYYDDFSLRMVLFNSDFESGNTTDWDVTQP